MVVRSLPSYLFIAALLIERFRLLAPSLGILLVLKRRVGPGVGTYGPGCLRFSLVVEMLELSMYDEIASVNRVKVCVNEVATRLALVLVFKLCGVCH